MNMTAPYITKAEKDGGWQAPILEDQHCFACDELLREDKLEKCWTCGMKHCPECPQPVGRKL